MKQESFFDYFETPRLKKRYTRTVHGGAKTKNHRKEERPLSTTKWIHLCLKSSKAKVELSFLHMKNKSKVEEILREKAKKFHIKIAEFVNVGNHLHLKIKIPSRLQFQKFLKSVTCLIARKITKASRSRKFGKFWQGLAFTRILQTAIEELQLKGYFEANRIEAKQSTAHREEFLKNFNRWIYKMRNRQKFQSD